MKFSAIILALAFLSATAADEKRLTIYTSQTSYPVSVVERDGREYVSLLDVLTPLGSAAARQDGEKWKLAFNRTESEFKNGKNKAKVNRKDLQMSAPFVLDNARGLVPLPSVATLISRLLGVSVQGRETARRILVGVDATQFSAQLQSDGPRLVLHFSAPVNPSIATEPGKLRMVFARDPVVAVTGAQSFDDKIIRGTNFSEHDGIAELAIQGGAPLQAAFSDQNRTITITPAPQPRAQAAVPASAPPATPAPSAAAPSGQAAQTTAPGVAHGRATVVIDPGHGGDDRGAVLSETLVEKEVTLAWARRLRAALDQKGISAMLLRDSDVSLTSDQRAALANASRPVYFITLHAGSTGTGVRVYTAQLPESAPRAGGFLPWNTAQGAFLDASRALAGSLVAELNRRQMPVGTAPVLMRPLNNVSAAAVAIEVMPPAADIAGLLSTSYQQAVCVAIADGIAGASRPAPPRSGSGETAP